MHQVCILSQCNFCFFHLFLFLFADQLLWVLKFILDCSATSVDVEEHLYKLATNMGITVITSSQVSARITPHDNVKFLMMANCSVHVLKNKKKRWQTVVCCQMVVQKLTPCSQEWIQIWLNFFVSTEACSDTLPCLGAEAH